MGCRCAGALVFLLSIVAAQDSFPVRARGVDEALRQRRPRPQGTCNDLASCGPGLAGYGWDFGDDAESDEPHHDGDVSEGRLSNFSLSEWTKRFVAGGPFANKQGDEERLAFMQSKVDLDMSVVDLFDVPLALPAWPMSQKTVAFLFMTMEGLDFEDIWDSFFADAKYGAYSIYIHQAGKRQADGRLRGAEKPLPLERWGAVGIPQVETSWCALLGVEIALLHAALQDARNVQFVFVSQNTIPLKPFSYVHRQLVDVSPDTSKFCFAEPAQYKLSATETVRNELRRRCIFRDFYRALNPRTIKHHQWVVLSREHSRALIRRAREGLEIWKDTWQAAAPDVAGMGEGCSDEAVPATALLHDLSESGRSTGNTWADLNRLGVEQQCLTWVLWRHCYGGTELEVREPIAKELKKLVEHGDIRMLTDKEFNFYKSDLKRELNGYPAVLNTMPLDYLQKLVNSGFMFARKFTPGLAVGTPRGTISLEAVLPELWQSVREEQSSQRVWSRLDAAGMPRPI